MQQIDFYCKSCKKTMKLSYGLTGDSNATVLPGMIIRCHTNKCTRVAILKKYTEGMIIDHSTKEGKYFI